MNLRTAIALFVDDYLERRSLSPLTVRAYRQDLRHLDRFLGPGVPLRAISTEALERWILSQDSYTQATRRRRLASLRSFFRFTSARSLTEDNPTERVRLRLPRRTRLPRYLSAAQAHALVKAAEACLQEPSPLRLHCGFLQIRNLLVVRILLTTGMRVAELTALDVSHFDLNDRTILVRGKGDRDRLCFLSDTRTRTALTQYIDARQHIETDSPALLLNSRAGRLTPQGVTYVLGCLARRARLGVSITPHMLRHTAATLFLRAGADIRLVQQFLGHSSIATTQIYAHVTQSHLRAALASSGPACLIDL